MEISDPTQSSPCLIMEISKPTHELTGAMDAIGAELLSTRYACGTGNKTSQHREVQAAL